MDYLNPAHTVAIAGHTHQREYLPQIASLLDELRTRSIRIAIEPRFASYLSDNSVRISPDEICATPPAEADAAISIGGDGTFLRTARWIGSLEIPVLGINTGHLGFLASQSPDESRAIADMLAKGEATVESRLALRLDAPADPSRLPPLPYALNEVALLKEETASMLNINVGISGTHLADFLADGLIISTPTGSTGYSLSVGGPIIFPTLDVVCIAPIAPHTLTARPIVAPGDGRITTCTTSRASSYRVSLDGVSFIMPVGTPLTITRADFSPRVIHPLDESFAATLREKLHWGVR